MLALINQIYVEGGEKMRKIIGVLLVVFVAAFIFGTTSPTADAANCYYKCSCTGAPLKCCVNNGVETCKHAIGIYCPAIITC